MQEYIDELREKVGLTEEQARKAIETIVAKVKTKIPEALHGSIDSIFSGKTGDTAEQKARSFSDQAEDNIKEFRQQAREEIRKFAEEAEERAGEMREKAEDLMKELNERLSGFLHKKTPPPGSNA